MVLTEVLHSHRFSVDICFLMGALHALEPGHGKTALAAHLLAEKGVKRPFLIALSTAFSHSLSILLIASLVHGALDFVLTEDQGAFFRGLNLVSGVGLLLAGLFLFLSARKKHHVHAHNCGCKAHRQKDVAPSKDSFNTMLLGFAVGLIPCPTALAAMSQAIVSRNWFSAGVVILAFAGGIFFSLFSIGSLLGTQAAPRLLKMVNASRLRLNPRFIQIAVVAGTGAWHIFLSL